MSDAATASKQEGTEKMEVADEKPNMEEVGKAVNLLAQGKRNMLCSEVPQAVNQFQEACKTLAKEYGETAKECGDAYYCYGKALLEFSRMESGVLGNALDGIEEDEEESSKSESSSDDKIEDPEKVSEEEREKISIDVYNAMEEREDEKKAREEKEKVKEKDGEEVKPDEKKDEKETKETENKEEMETDETEKKDDETEGTEAESEDLNTEEEGDTEGGDTEEGETEDKEGETKDKEGETEDKEGKEDEKEKEEKEEEEDVSNLQLAWEMLELSKIIFKRESVKESRMKLAETHLKLGEVALETEQYDTAIGDFKECLKIQKDHLEPADRCLAETHYQLGLAYTFACHYDEAITNCKEAASVIEAKIKELDQIIEEGEKQGKGKDIADFEDPVYKAHKEIKELKEILPDILAKIEDVIEEQKTADEAKRMVKEAVGLGEKAGTSASAFGEGSSTSTGEANVITHLARKKRKTDEDCETDEKKAKVENGSGDACVNGIAEGVKTKTVEEVKGAAEAKS